MFDFVSQLPYPFSVVGPVVGIWYVIGIVYLIYLYARKPERVRDTARVFIERRSPRPRRPCDLTRIAMEASARLRR